MVATWIFASLPKIRIRHMRVCNTIPVRNRDEEGECAPSDKNTRDIPDLTLGLAFLVHASQAVGGALFILVIYCLTSLIIKYNMVTKYMNCENL